MTEAELVELHRQAVLAAAIYAEALNALPHIRIEDRLNMQTILEMLDSLERDRKRNSRLLAGTPEVKALASGKKKTKETAP